MEAGAFGSIGSEIGGAAGLQGSQAAGMSRSGVGRPFGAAWDPTGQAYRSGIAAGRQPLFVGSSGNPRSRSGDDAHYTLEGLTGSPMALGALSAALYGLKVGFVPSRESPLV